MKLSRIFNSFAKNCIPRKISSFVKELRILCIINQYSGTVFPSCCEGNKFDSAKVELGAVTTMRGLLGMAAGEGVRGDW